MLCCRCFFQLVVRLQVSIELPPETSLHDANLVAGKVQGDLEDIEQVHCAFVSVRPRLDMRLGTDEKLIWDGLGAGRNKQHSSVTSPCSSCLSSGSSFDNPSSFDNSWSTTSSGFESKA